MQDLLELEIGQDCLPENGKGRKEVEEMGSVVVVESQTWVEFLKEW